MFILRNVFGQIVGEYRNESLALNVACKRSERTRLPITIYNSDTMTKYATVSYDSATCVDSVSFNEE